MNFATRGLDVGLIGFVTAIPQAVRIRSAPAIFVDIDPTSGPLVLVQVFPTGCEVLKHRMPSVGVEVDVAVDTVQVAAHGVLAWGDCTAMGTLVDAKLALAVGYLAHMPGAVQRELVAAVGVDVDQEVVAASVRATHNDPLVEVAQVAVEDAELP